MAASIEDFCRRIQAGLANASFTQRRTLVELLVDRVLVINDQVEIRYVVPTHPRGETTRFCHLRKDYFQHIIQVRTGPAPATQLAAFLQFFNGRRIGCMPVDIDDAGSDLPRPP